MSLTKNQSGQKIRVFAFDATLGTPKSGDAANITASVSKDFGAFADLADTSASEEDSTKAKGYYLFDISQTETNADDIAITGRSTTSNIVVVGAPARMATRPANSGALSIDSSGRVDVIKVNGTSQTARDLGASVLLSVGTGTGQVNLSSGKAPATLAASDVTGNVAADVQTIKTQAVTCAAGVTVAAFVGNATAALGVDASGRIDLGKWLGTAPLTLSSQQVQSVVPSSTVVASVSGAVGSVTGAVGSVTGAVGSVTGAVTLSAGDSPVFYSSTATAGGASTLTDSGQSWTVNALAGCRVKITSGTGTKQSRVIVSNTATALTVDRAWTTTPSTDSVYAVVENEQPALSSGLKVTGVVLADTVTTYTGNTPQTGDSYARIGAAGAGLTALGDSRIAHLDADVTSRLAPTVAGRTLDVSATGEAGLDWANIGAPTTTVALTGTTISTSQVAASVTAGVTVTTNNDKTGYSISGTKTTLDGLNDITAAAVWAAGTRTLTASLDPTSAVIAAAVWDLATSGHTTSGTFGAAMNAAGSAGDPWGTALPGPYGPGTAGFLVGSNLNATVSSRSTYAGGDTSGTTTLLARLTTLRTGYLDNLSGGAVALAGSAPSWYVAPVDVSANVSAIKAKTDNLPAAPADETLIIAATNSLGGSLTTLLSRIPGVVQPQTGDSYARLGSGVALTSAGLDTVHVETGLNVRQALAIIASACAGVLSGASGTAIAIAAAGVPATNRIAATVDGDGNRTAVTLTPPA